MQHFNKMMLWFWLLANVLISRIIHIETTNEACRGEYSVSGKFLKGHTFKTITVDSPTRCQMLCSQDVRCQSYNFIIGKHICELNNRTKEARPEDIVDDPWRFYMKDGFSRGMEVVSYISRVLNTKSGISIFTFCLNNVTFPQSFEIQQQRWYCISSRFQLCVLAFDIIVYQTEESQLLL